MTGANLCVHCGRPCPDGYADSDCAHQAGDRLRDIGDMMLAARDIATGMARHGSSGSSEAESRIPLNLGATERLNAVEGNLAGWCRHVIEQRGGGIVFNPRQDRIAVIALWLAGHVEWIRHRQEADEFLSDVELCHRVVRSLARGPSEQKFLGPCGAPLLVEGIAVGDQDQPWAGCGETVSHPAHQLRQCDGDVYAYRGAKKGRCKACGAEVATSEREAWLDGEVRQHAFRASEIANAYGVNVDTIRSWATPREEIRDRAGKVTQYARPALLHAHTHDRHGRPLYMLGDVLDLAAKDKARKAELQAKRARRAAAKAAESEDAA